MPGRSPATLASTALAALLLNANHAGADERDAIIRDLQRRVEALEQKLNEKTVSAPQAPTTQQAAKPLDDEESTRALERALTRQGGLVLPSGTYELEPRLEYSYRGTDGLAIATLSGQQQVTNQVVRRNRVEPSLGIRFGLPEDSQLEARFPYAIVREDRATAGTLRQTGEDTGVGDIELGFTKQLQTERGARPGVLGSLTWKMPTGDFRVGEPSAGSGFHSLQAAVTAVKRQDPLVFFGTLTYTSVFERRHQGLDIEPGNPMGLKFGAILAASPQTALRANFEVSRAGMIRINGTKVPGSDTTAGTLQLGFATLMGRQALFDLQFGIGVTRDAPDFRITAAVPIRLN